MILPSDVKTNIQILKGGIHGRRVFGQIQPAGSRKIVEGASLAEVDDHDTDSPAIGEIDFLSKCSSFGSEDLHPRLIPAIEFYCPTFTLPTFTLPIFIFPTKIREARDILRPTAPLGGMIFSESRSPTFWEMSW
jgi:hypothetical protein